MILECLNNYFHYLIGIFWINNQSQKMSIFSLQAFMVSFKYLVYCLINTSLPKDIKASSV